MTVGESEKDKEITRLKRELNKVNNDLAKKKEELKSTRSELRGGSRLRIIKKEQTIRLTEEQSRLLSELLGDTSITSLVIRLAVLLGISLANLWFTVYSCNTGDPSTSASKGELFDSIPCDQVTQRDWVRKGGVRYAYESQGSIRGQ